MESEMVVYGLYPVCSLIIGGAGWIINNKLCQLKEDVKELSKEVNDLRVHTEGRMSVVETKLRNNGGK